VGSREPDAIARQSDAGPPLEPQVSQYTQIMMCASVSLGTPGPTARDRAGNP
jgi:hypothetical protein